MKARLQISNRGDGVAEFLARVGQLPRVDLCDNERTEDRYLRLLSTVDDRRWSALLADAGDDEILAVAVRPHIAT